MSECTVKCRLCGLRIEVTPGMDEMVEHWKNVHPRGFQKLRKRTEEEMEVKLPREEDD